MSHLHSFDSIANFIHELEMDKLRRNARPAAATPRQRAWFEKPTVVYSFSHPHVMSRLERLMGTNVVRITDRKYMLELQRRIREDHVRSVRERIRAREVDELEREKKLILDGRMSLDEAPKELVDHPVFQISQFIKSVLLGGKIPGYLQAARNHVQPSRLCQMASTMSRSSSSRGVLSLSRSCLASEDGGERTLATPTTLAAAASRPPSTSASSRVASSRDTSPRDGGGSPKGSTRSARSGGSARAEDAAEATTAEVEADAEDEAAALKARGSASPAASAQSAKSVSLKDEPATSTQEAGAGGVVVQVEDGDDALLSGLSACDFEEDFDRQADIERGYMYTQEEHDRIKFEAESVKKMWELETVEELYALAESIVREMVAQDGGNVLSAPAPATAPAPSKDGDRTPSPSRSTKSPPPGGT